MQHNGKFSYDDLVVLDYRWGLDIYASDGKVSNGWRVVRKGGWVKMWGQWWRHTKLLPFVGARVWISAEDYWLQNCHASISRRRVVESRLGGFICALSNPVFKRN
jgi:hypothetical protein